MSLASLVLAAAVQPVPSPTPEQVDRIRAIVESQAADEHRIRVTRGAVGVGIGAVGIGLGAYVLTTLQDNGPTVRRAAIVQMLGGSGLVLQSFLNLIRRGALQRLVGDPAFEPLRSGTAEGAEFDAFELRLAELSRHASIERRLVGSANLIAGLVILALGGALLFRPEIEERPEGEAILGATMLTSGLSYASVGVLSLALPVQAERFARSYFAMKRERPIRMAVTPQFGAHVRGVALAGRF